MEGRGALACTSILRAASSTEQSQIQQMTGAAGNTRWQRADSAGYMQLSREAPTLTRVSSFGVIVEAGLV